MKYLVVVDGVVREVVKDYKEAVEKAEEYKRKGAKTIVVARIFREV